MRFVAQNGVVWRIKPYSDCNGLIENARREIGGQGIYCLKYTGAVPGFQNYGGPSQMVVDLLLLPPPFTHAKELGFVQISWVILLGAGGFRPLDRPPCGRSWEYVV